MCRENVKGANFHCDVTVQLPSAQIWHSHGEPSVLWDSDILVIRIHWRKSLYYYTRITMISLNIFLCPALNRQMRYCLIIHFLWRFLYSLWIYILLCTSTAIIQKGRWQFMIHFLWRFLYSLWLYILLCTSTAIIQKGRWQFMIAST